MVLLKLSLTGVELVHSTMTRVIHQSMLQVLTVVQVSRTAIAHSPGTR